MPSPIRRGLRRLTIFGGGLCLLVVLLVLALQSDPARAFVLRRLTAVLAKEQIGMEIDELRYNLFRLSVDARNLRIRSLRSSDLPTFATIGRVSLDLRPSQLFRGRLVVHAAAMQDVDISYVADADGRDNLPRLPAAQREPREPIDYFIATLSISNARVRYSNLAQAIDVALPLPSIDVTGNATTGRHQLRFDSTGGELHVGPHAAAIEHVAGALDIGRDDVRIDRLQLEALGSQAQLAGVVRGFDAPALGLTLHSTIDTSRVAAFLGTRERVVGTIAVDSTIDGPFTAPTIAAQLSGSTMQVRSLAVDRVDARAAYDVSARRAVVSSIRIEAPWGRFTANGELAVDRGRTSRVHAEASGVRVNGLMHGLMLPAVVETRVDGTLDTEWPGLDYREVSGAGSATLTPTKPATARDSVPIGGHVVLRGHRGTIVADLQQISAAGGEASGRVQVGAGGGLEGDLHGSVPNLARTIDAVETVLGRAHGAPQPAALGGAALVDVRLTGTFGEPAAHAKITAPSLSLAGADGINIGADITATRAALTVTRADATWDVAHAVLSGTVGLTGDRRIDLVLDADAPRVEALARAVAPRAPPLWGSVSAHGTMQGTLARPLGSLTFRAIDIIALDERFGSLSADLVSAGNDLTLSRLLLEKPQPDGPGRITATGSYNLHRGSGSLDLQSDNLRLLGVQLPDGHKVRAGVQLAAEAAGSTSAPSGTLTLVADSLEIDAPQPRALGRVSIHATAANRQATITASAESFNLEAKALVDLLRPWPSTLAVRVRDLDLERLPLAPDARLSGQLRATVDATGNLAEPAHARATANIQELAGSWNGQAFRVTNPVDLHYADQRLDIDRLQVAARDSSLIVKGQLPLTSTAGAGDLAIEATAGLPTLTQALLPNTPVTAGGTVTLAGSLRGTLAAIDPDVVITVANGAFSSPDIKRGASNVELRARVAEGAATIERLTGAWGLATISATGTIPLDVLPRLPVELGHATSASRLDASVRDLDLSSVPGIPAGLTGEISADLEASAPRADLAALEGRVTFPKLEIASNRLTLVQQEPSSISVHSGMATVDHLTLSGSAGNLTAGGTVGLLGERPLDVKMDGTIAVGALSMLMKGIRSEGTATLQAAVRGTMAAPKLSGTASLADATIASDALKIAATNVNAHVDLSGARVALTTLTGEINGGTLEGSGSMTLGHDGINDVDLQVSARDFAYDAPLKLRSVSDTTLRLRHQSDEFLLAGQLTIKEAGLTDDIDFDDSSFAAIDAPRTVDVGQPRNAFLDRVRFAIDIDTAAPAIVDNHLARAEINADLRIVGTPYDPGLTGRLRVVEGSEITLNARRYEVERGVITFVDERRIVPSMDLLLNTKASNYNVRIAVAGTPGKTETTWTSEPPLPEPDVMSLLVTGRTLDEMRGEESEVARVQALSYLTGRVGSKVGRGFERATGISEVRIEPVLIANETDPTARLTVGQNVTDQVKLIYSTNLTDSNDQIWVAEYDVTRRFQMRGVRERDDDSYRFDFRHDIRFGGDPAPARQARRRETIASLAVVGDSAIDEATLRKLFKLKTGDAYEFFSVREGVERIEKAWLESGYLQARIHVDRKIDNDAANLTLQVTSGPVVELRFEGATPPSDVQKQVRAAWHHGVFDTQRGNDGVQALRAWLMHDKHLEPVVTYTIEDVGARRRVVFRIQPGPRYDRVALVFEGASAIQPDRLERIIAQEHLERQLFTDPAAVTDILERYYREQGHLSAEIDDPRPEFNGTTARVVLTVREGPRFVVRHVTSSGNTVFPSNEILAKLPVVFGEPFLSAAAEYSLERIRELYWRKGYNDLKSEYSLVIDRSAASVDVAFAIVEGRQSVIAAIDVDGNKRTSEQLVRGQLELAPLQPLDLAALARSRRNLYSTGAFSIADITRDDMPDGHDDAQKPVRLTVSVREVQPVQLRYGLSYDTEGGLGGILDISNHNLLGKARVFGLQGRYDSEIHEGRFYVSQPSLRSWPRKTTASVYFREDLNPPTDQTDPFDISRQGASVQQEAQLHQFYVLSYGYRYELATTLEPSLGVGVTETVRVTPLSTTLTRETRDEVLDASKGSFLSQAFAYSPDWLGSDRPYLKYYGQYFYYFPLRAPRQKPFSNEVIPARLVFATGVRVGLAHGLGGEVPTSERFYAGGSTTLRGFEQNTVGPIGVNNVPAGGNASLVLNNELRMPLVRRIDGVLFVDVGNIYPTIRDFSLTDVRESAGIGIRLRTPWVLLRTDYGFVLDPRPGERRGRFYLSIGQAF